MKRIHKCSICPETATWSMYQRWWKDGLAETQISELCDQHKKLLEQPDMPDKEFRLIKAIVLVIAVLWVGLAHAQTPITACGTISAPGTYIVTQLAAQGDCLIIAGPNITIAQGSYGQMIGNGTGIGLHILASATNFVLSGCQLTLSNFPTGIEDEAPGATICAQVNATGQPGGIGLYLLGGGHSRITGNYEGFAYGAELQNSNGNVLHSGSFSTYMGGAGIFVWGGSQNNLIYGNQIAGSGLGVRIRWDSPNNRVIANNVATAGPNLFQGTNSSTVGCNGDFWLGNVTGVEANQPASANQACINDP